MDEWMDGWMERWKFGLIDGLMFRWMDRWNGWTEYVYIYCSRNQGCIKIRVATDGQMNGKMDVRMGGWSDVSLDLCMNACFDG